MKFAEFVVVAAVGGEGEIEVAVVEAAEAVVVAASWLCLPCHPLWSNGPYQRRAFDKRMRHKEGS